jgi:hypothetical protein
MCYFKQLLAVVAFLVITACGRSADKELAPAARQEKTLKEFQKSLEAAPLNPLDAEAQLKQAQQQFRKFLSAKTVPAPAQTNTLAASLVHGINLGVITTPQALLVAKALENVLNLPQITIHDTYQFTRTIEPIVESIGLPNGDRMRLYREILMVVKTAPTYAPDQR